MPTIAKQTKSQITGKQGLLLLEAREHTADQAPSDGHVTGTVTKLIWTDRTSDFRIFEVALSARERKVVLGEWSRAKVGVRVEAFGQWKRRKGTDELQFHAGFLQEVIPEDASGLLAWLETGVVKGIGKPTARKLVDHFGAQLTEILDHCPERLTECGIPAKRCEKIRASWGEAQATRMIMQFLRKIGIGPERSNAVWKHFSKFRWVGNNPATLTSRLGDNPYMLTDVRGIGFVQADQAAGKMGVPADSDYRVDAGIRHVIVQITDDGHVWMPLGDLTQKALELLGVDRKQITDRIQSMVESETLVLRPSNGALLVSTKKLANIEGWLASEIARLNRPATPIPAALPTGFRPDPTQVAALEMVLRSGLAVLTGGPGMGKTTLIRACVLSAQKDGLSVTLCAPTGRAAKRMEEATGLPASTIHRALEWRYMDGPVRDNGNPLDTDWVIVDEVSMLDQEIAWRLLRAVRDGTRVLFVGDPDQLPSVGAGNVLGDILKSGIVPVARLTKIFRQGEGSGIPILAKAILEGRQASFHALSGVEYLDLEDFPKESAFDRVIGTVSEFTRRTGIRVQVLSPMRGGPLGTITLNRALRELYNPDRGQDHSGFHRIGDLLIQTKNNYRLNVFNGDMGTVVGFERDGDDITMLVDFDGTVVRYEDKDDLAALEYAWALTIHKSQGGQFPAVCVVATTSHFVMLKRNLIYTGITRAEKHLFVLSGEKAFGLVRRKSGIEERCTLLTESICQSAGKNEGRPTLAIHIGKTEAKPTPEAKPKTEPKATKKFTGKQKEEDPTQSNVFPLVPLQKRLRDRRDYL